MRGQSSHTPQLYRTGKGWGWHTPIIPGLEKQWQANICELKAILAYTRWIWKEIQVVVVYTFNLSVWDHTLLIPALGSWGKEQYGEQREEYKGEETGTH